MHNKRNTNKYKNQEIKIFTEILIPDVKEEIGDSSWWHLAKRVSKFNTYSAWIVISETLQTSRACSFFAKVFKNSDQMSNDARTKVWGDHGGDPGTGSCIFFIFNSMVPFVFSNDIFLYSRLLQSSGINSLACAQATLLPPLNGVSLENLVGEREIGRGSLWYAWGYAVILW